MFASSGEGMPLYCPPPIVKEIIKERERRELRKKVKEEKHLEIYGGSREDIRMKTCLHGPMDYAIRIKNCDFV